MSCDTVEVIIPPTVDTRPEWGLTASIPITATLSWGARAIYRSAVPSTETLKTPTGKIKMSKGRPVTRTVYSPMIDLLHDRQGFNSLATGDERKALAEWLNTIGLAAIRALCKEHRIQPSDDGPSARVEHTSNGYTIIACPNGSHGYLYIAAWRDDHAPGCSRDCERMPDGQLACATPIGGL